MFCFYKSYPLTAPRGIFVTQKHPTQVSQVVQLHQDGISTSAIARRFAVFPSTVSKAWGTFQETGSYSGELDRAVEVPRRNRMSTARAKKLTFCMTLLQMSLIKQSEKDFMRVA